MAADERTTGAGDERARSKPDLPQPEQLRQPLGSSPRAPGDEAAAPEDDRPELLIKLQERKQRHQERGRLTRLGVVALGVFLIPVGLLLSAPGVPGPGFAVILLGISFLALEFDPAERLLERVIIWGDQIADRVKVATPREKLIAGIVGALALAGAVAVVLLWDVPLVPVL